MSESAAPDLALTLFRMAFAGLAVLLAFICVASVAYLLCLLVGAAMANRKPAIDPKASPPSMPHVAIVVPAHNEEMVIGATLASLSRLDWPADRFEVVVVADNCSDRTAEIAADATVLTRTDTDRRGKGYALAWAFERLLARDAGEAPENRVAAFIIVDADTLVDTAFLREIAAILWDRGPFGDASVSAVVQGRYGVANSAASWRSALMTAAFDLVNHVKPTGRDRMGATVGLKGNGMAFTRSIIERAPFTGDSITEDIDYALDLLEIHGLAVRYAPRARVVAQMPVSSSQAVSQRRRWESGRYRLLRERAPSLFRAFLRRRDFRCLEAACDLVTPPLAELAAFLALWAGLCIAGVSFGWIPFRFGRQIAEIPVGGGMIDKAVWLAGPLMVAVGFVVYVLGGLALAGARRDTYLALLRAPGYALWKLALYVRAPAPQDWIRTSREPTDASAPGNADTGDGSQRFGGQIGRESGRP